MCCVEFGLLVWKREVAGISPGSPESEKNT